MCPKNRSVEPARPCCFPVLGSPVFTALGSSLSVWLVFPGKVEFFQVLIDVSEPKRNKNLGFVSTKRTKAASRCQIVTIVTKNRMIFWSENSPLEPARPCCFPVLGPPGFYSVGVLSQRSAGGFWCEIVSKPGQNFIATGGFRPKPRPKV